MSSNRLILQLTLALVAFVAAEAGPPLRAAKLRDSGEPLGSSDPDIPSYYDPQDDCIFDPLPPEMSFTYYTRKYPSGKVLDFFAPPVKDLHVSTTTKVITHGMISSLNSSEIRSLINAYLNSTERMNVITLDWSGYTQDMYREAAKSSVRVGKIAAALFCVLYKGFDIYPYQMHFIGHGLGAHLLGVTAREARTSVGRITGLDPARLCFEIYCHGLHFPQLNKNDATFVDVIHTDAGHTGVGNTHGTVDFYANYGTFQPKCHNLTVDIPKPGCDSLTSVTYFTETIVNPVAYYANLCTSPYPTLNCKAGTGMYMGEYVEQSARGIYNFRTSETFSETSK